MAPVKKTIARRDAKPAAKSPARQAPKAEAKPASRGASRPPPHACLDRGALVGDARVRRGFAFHEDDDRLFALGYPHIALLVSPHPDEKQLARTVPQAFGVCPYHVEWPRALATPFLRIYPRYGEAFKPGTRDLSPAGRAIIREASPLTEDELGPVLELLLTEKGVFAPFVRSTLLLSEALLAERATAQLVKVLAGLPASRFSRHDVNLYVAIELLAVMLLRAPAGPRDDMVLALEKLFTKLPAPAGGRSADILPRRALDALLHGEPGAKRAFPNGRGLGSLAFLDISPATALAAMKSEAAAGRVPPDPDARRVFLAGPDALDIESKWLKTYLEQSSFARERILETYGRVNDPRTVEIVLELTSGSRVAARATRWLKSHRDLAEPVLARLAGGRGPKTSAAKAALAKLD